MATLTVSHFLYLTREQRYDLHSGKPLDLVGVSIPVWFLKGNTSEPAVEVFCKYKLTNENPNKPVNSTDVGFEINLPQKFDVFPEDFIIPEGVSEESAMETFNKLPMPEQLLDPSDGGEKHLSFKQNQKVIANGVEFNIVHIVEIRDEDFLLNSLDVL